MNTRSYTYQSIFAYSLNLLQNISIFREPKIATTLSWKKHVGQECMRLWNMEMKNGNEYRPPN